MLPSFEYARPKSLGEAVKLLAEGRTRIHGGGTDLIGCMRDGVLAPRRVVSLVDVGELRGIRESADGGVRIGAMTSLTEVAEHPAVRGGFAGVAQAASLVASPQLRNQGTIGGNLCQKPRCWYYRGDFACARKGGDTCYAFCGENQYHAILGGETCYYVHPSDAAPALIAADAAVRIHGPGGSRLVPLEKFFVRPNEDFQRETVIEDGEILTEVVVPAPPEGARSAYRKVRARGSWDFALTGVAVSLAVRGGVVRHVRIVLSGVAPVPWRAVAAERTLLGHALDRPAAARAATAAVEGAHPLELNGYKVPMARGIVEETLVALA